MLSSAGSAGVRLSELGALDFHPEPRFQPAGDSAVLVSFSRQIDLEINRRVHALARIILAHPIPGIQEPVPGYATLLVHYDPATLNFQQVQEYLHQNLSTREVLSFQPKRVEIPVVYGGEHGPDLAFVAEHNHLLPEALIQIHASRDYPVYMMGFTPGFPYLGGMDPAIAAPRLSTPRKAVPGGSVGIAGEQTGIYPIESPGGWRIIGHTSARLFDPQREPPFLLSPGDLVRFVPVKALE